MGLPAQSTMFNIHFLFKIKIVLLKGSMVIKNWSNSTSKNNNKTATNGNSIIDQVQTEKCLNCVNSKLFQITSGVVKSKLSRHMENTSVEYY